jgi:hypothetical protein
MILMLRAGRAAPHFLLVLFAGWILAPFLVLLWASVAADRWSSLTRAALHGLTLAITVVSLALYAFAAFRPPPSRPAAVFVAVPPASLMIMAVVVGMAALISRKARRTSE